MCGVSVFLQSSHYWFWILNSLTIWLCSFMPESGISLWIVALTFKHLECGSVHMNPESISFTRFVKPFTCLRQYANSCGDSGSMRLHGGLRHLSHSLQ